MKKQKTKVKKSDMKFETKIKNLIKLNNNDIKFQQMPTAEIANYFRTKLYQSGYSCTPDNWEKTKNAAIKIMEDQDLRNLSNLSWMECIDWCFSVDRYRDKFWCRVSILSLETVLKTRNDFMQWRAGKKALAQIGQQAEEENAKRFINCTRISKREKS